MLLILSGDGYIYTGLSSTPNMYIKKSPNEKLSRKTGNDIYLKIENILYTISRKLLLAG
jgi:hypothetical protein